jgi:type II secretory pathway component PulF
MMGRPRPKELESMLPFVDTVFSIVGYIFNFLFRGSYRRRYLQDFAEHLRMMVERRLPLAEGIERFGDSRRGFGARYVMRSVADLIRRGVPLHEAISRHSPTFFPEDFVTMVRAGEKSGMLPQALESVIEDMTFHRDVKMRFTWTCLYLGGVFTVVFLVTLAICTWVLPRFYEFWDQANAQLPAATLMVIRPGGHQIGGILYPAILFGFPLTIFLVYLLSRFELGIPEFLASVLPGVRGAFVRYQRGRFLTALGMLLGGKAPIEEAVRAAGEVSRFRRLRGLAKASGGPLREGIPLSKVLAESGVFDPKSLWRIRSGERRGNLPEVLYTLGAEEQEAGHRRWIYLLAWFRPAAVIVIAVFEFLIVLATYAPLFHIGDIILTEYL